MLLPTWNSISDQDIVGYNVYYKPAGAPAASKASTICDGGDTDVDAGTTTAQSFTLNALGDDGGDGGDDGDDDAATPTDSGTVTATSSQGCYTSTPINATPIADAGVPYHPSGVQCPSPFPAGSTGSGDGGDLSGVTTDTDASTEVTSVTEDGSVGTISTAASVADITMQPREVQKNSDGTLVYPFVTATGNTAVSATLSGLTNNVEYVVAVAATDAYGNVGALSTFNGSNDICQWPQQVTDFFDSYRSAGGEAGGSFCSLESPELPTGAGGSALVAGIALVFALRRRRR